MDLDEYRKSLAPLRRPVPIGDLDEHREIREAAHAFAAAEQIDDRTVATMLEAHPSWVPALALVVGLSRESLKNVLRHRFHTGGWVTLAKTRATEVVHLLDEEYGLLTELELQRKRQYVFGDVLVARSGSRQVATAAIASGRALEDVIEKVARDLDLAYALRTQFEGRNGQKAPCDLAIPAGGKHAQIVVAAKGFDSTGSKLSDAVREIVEMAEVRLPTQFVFAVVDGIGWTGRRKDLERIHDLAVSKRIDGLYTLAMLDTFVADIANAAKLRGLKR